MDDETKEFKKIKPQQRIYKPGSGPLKRSEYGVDSKMDSYTSENVPHYNSKPSYRESTATRQRKPQQQLYVARSYDNVNERNSTTVGIDNASQQFSRKLPDNNTRNHYRRTNNRRDMSCSELMNKDSNNDHNYNRNYRQISEPRSMTPTKTMQDLTLNDRNRDTRSMETSAGRHAGMGGGKPPTGRRNSAGYSSDFSRHKYSFNIDNLPPRLKRKYLEQAGQQTNSFDSSDQMYREKQGMVQPAPAYNQNATLNNTCGWSQTLPSRGRGRLRDNESFDKEKFINTYLKSYEAHNSRRSTPSNSYMNLYEPDTGTQPGFSQEIHNQKEIISEPNNGIERRNHTYNKNTETKKYESDSETTSYSSPNLMDMTNLDWTEEVEKNIKIDDLGDSTGSSLSLNIKSTSYSLDNKPPEVKSAEPKEPKRRSRRRDKRSSSRGQRNEKKGDRGKKDAIQPIQTQSSNDIRNERERRDSHRSNLSSTIGNSRDDLDKWRSLRSFSREHSTEGRLVSQCNSRDTSMNRMMNVKDSDGFRIPSSNLAQKKSGEVWSNARPCSVERRRESPMRGGSVARDSGSTTTEAPSGGGRKSKRKSGRRRNGRNNDSANRNTESMGRNSETPSRQEPIANAHAMTANNTASSINWREEIIESKKMNERSHHGSNRSRLNSTQSDKSVVDSGPHPGLLILPQGTSHINKEKGREGSIETQKTLFDHHNPSKPIVVQTNNARLDSRMERGTQERAGSVGFSGGGAAERALRHRALLQEVDRADALLQAHSLRGPLVLLHHWPDVTDTRKFLQNALQRLLMSDLKYCQSDNIEHHFWKILYYNFIEISRKHISQAPDEDKAKIKQLINTIIEEGNTYFEQLVLTLEKTYKFNVDDFINDNHSLPPKGLGYIGLALISVQKLYVFLGDLARYREQIKETNNYARSKFWYTKAQQINPKNGRPYNQLAILAIYARRKLDAVYYYMRSLMSSNPFHSARESLISLFDENRKKYEAAEKKRRALSAGSGAGGAGGAGEDAGEAAGARGTVWIRPDGGAGGAGGTGGPTVAPPPALVHMSPVELNKNFITSYLYVHGKLVTKIGMETFEESAALMLRQFRALLNQQPLPTPAARLLQLTALNMFAVETTANASQKGADGVARCTWVECALRVALLMFGALLDRCCALLPHPPNTQQHADALLLLPAIKVWSDWMLCHSSVWNPPPPLQEFGTDSKCDPWELLAKLMNILETLDDKSILFETEMKEDAVCVRLPEDSALAGFTPLMYMEPTPAYVTMPSAPSSISPHHAEHVLRTRKLLFFGTEYLVGVEPPVIKMEFPEDGPPRYVSAVLPPPPTHQLQDLCEDSEEEYKEEEESKQGQINLNEVVETSEADEVTQRLIRRKQQLEARRDNIQRRNQRMQEIVGESGAVVVRPRWLVPDTNCFIDHLHLLQRIVAAPNQLYQLVVPLVVMSELEGLSLCGRVGPLAGRARRWAEGERRVRGCSAQGSFLGSRTTTFTAEAERPLINDDTVLATAAALLRNHLRDDGVLEVVLLTEDRALRVKALAADVPTRDLPSFITWAGLDEQTQQEEEEEEDFFCVVFEDEEADEDVKKLRNLLIMRKRKRNPQQPYCKNTAPATDRIPSTKK